MMRYFHLAVVGSVVQNWFHMHLMNLQVCVQKQWVHLLDTVEFGTMGAETIEGNSVDSFGVECST